MDSQKVILAWLDTIPPAEVLVCFYCTSAPTFGPFCASVIALFTYLSCALIFLFVDVNTVFRTVDQDMCLPLLTSSGRHSYKSARSDTHDIFVEARPQALQGDWAYRARQLDLDPSIVLDPPGGCSRVARMPKRRLAIVVRRTNKVDHEHEQGELGRRYWPDRGEQGRWSAYLRTRGNIEMRGGKLHRASPPEREEQGAFPGFQTPPEMMRGSGPPVPRRRASEAGGSQPGQGNAIPRAPDAHDSNVGEAPRGEQPS